MGTRTLQGGLAVEISEKGGKGGKSTISRTIWRLGKKTKRDSRKRSVCDSVACTSVMTPNIHVCCLLLAP